MCLLELSIVRNRQKTGKRNQSTADHVEPGPDPLTELVLLTVLLFFALTVGLYSSAKDPSLSLIPFISYPAFYLLDLKFTYYNIYLPNPDEFSRRERNFFLVTLEERFGFKVAAIMNALVGLSTLVFASLFLAPIMARWLDIQATTLSHFAGGASAMASIHAHAWVFNKAVE